MRIFLAGASGVIGRLLVPRLVEAGHSVTGLTRTAAKAGAIRADGAEPVVCDLLDEGGVTKAVVGCNPDVVIQHVTDLPADLNPRNLARAYVANDRVRDEGSRNLMAAAVAARAHRYVAQNVCFFYAPEGRRVKDEDAPLFTRAPASFGRSGAIYEAMERRITSTRSIDGLVLRFGFWYGPQTTYASDGYTARQVRRRLYPVVGHGTGVFSFVHVIDVVEATLAALDHGRPGVYNVCDDEPAAMAEWLPYYADLLGARPPLHLPAWVARLVAGPMAGYWATEMRGATNAKAKREFSWSPRYSSWRVGFRELLHPPAT